MDVVGGTVREVPGGYRLVLRYRESGKLHQLTRKAGCADRIDAWRELAEWRDSMAGHRTDCPTVGEYVAGFIDGLDALGTVEKSTLNGYRHTLKHVQSLMGGKWLDLLTPEDVEKAQAQMVREGYSYSAVSKLRKLTNEACCDAVRRGKIASNPVETARGTRKGNKRPGINYLARNARRRLLEALTARPDEPVARAGMLALCCGMRAGEVCALVETDIDAFSREVRVRRSIGRTDTETYIKCVKAGKARSVPMPDELASAVGAWGELGNPSIYVVGGRTDPVNPNNLSRWWRRLAHELRLVGSEGRPVTFHDLRHTYATAALAGGMDVKTLSAILGHSSAAMTLDVYAALDSEARSRAGKVASQALFGA